MHKLLLKLALAAYATLVAVVGQFAAVDSAELGYSPLLVALSSVSALALGAAVLIVLLGWNVPAVVRYWKPVFWLNCCDLVIGMVSDWSAMSSPFWARILLFVVVLIFLGPAYYFSYALAYLHGSRDSTNRA